MIGEVHYWRDLARILDAANEEVKQSYVEISVQVLTHCGKGDESLQKSVDTFMKQKSKVALGTKEAKWNHKYMKIIEKPVAQTEAATDFKDI
jgi:predicted methyltransferase MtxX (methanogen marker protein 4)